MRTMLFVAGMLAMALVIGCGDKNNGSGDDSREVKPLSKCTVIQKGYYYIGVILPATGSLGGYGPPITQGAQLAISEVNQGGGINGKTIGMVQCDSATDATTSEAEMTEIGLASPIGAVIGDAASSCTLKAGAKAKEYKKVLISPASTSPAVSTLDDDGYVSRTCVSDAFQGKIAALIANRENFNKVYVINRNDAYGNGLREAFVSNFVTGGKTADYTTYNESDANYADTAIDKAIAFAPNAIFLIAFVDDGASILKAAKAKNVNVKWIFPDGIKDAQLVTKVGDAAYLEGIKGTVPADPKGAAYQALSARYKEKFGEDPKTYVAQGYDAAYLIAIAMALSSNPDDGTQIRDNLGKTKSGTLQAGGNWSAMLTAIATGQVNYDGASGPVDLDANGDVMSNIEEWTIQGGQIQSVGCWTPEGQACP